MTRTCRQGRDAQRGQSLVELALSLTVMVLLVSGAVSFGMAYFSYVSIRDAAQEGALYGSLYPCLDVNAPIGTCDPTEIPNVNSAEICGRVIAASTHADGTQAGPVDMSGFACNPRPPSDSDGNGIFVELIGSACEGSTGGTPNAIRVSVRYEYEVFMPLVGAIIGQEIPLTATVADTILGPRCPSS